MVEHLLGSEGPVTLITTFVVRDGEEDRFVDLWTEVGDQMRELAGYRGARLYRPLVGRDDAIRYVHVADWDNAALLAKARAEPGVRAAERRLDAAGLLAEKRRGLYQLAIDTVPKKA